MNADLLVFENILHGGCDIFGHNTTAIYFLLYKYFNLLFCIYSICICIIIPPYTARRCFCSRWGARIPSIIRWTPPTAAISTTHTPRRWEENDIWVIEGVWVADCVYWIEFASRNICWRIGCNSAFPFVDFTYLQNGFASFHQIIHILSAHHQFKFQFQELSSHSIFF